MGEKFYDHVSEFEPLVPSRPAELIERSRLVVAKSLELRGALHPATAETLRGLLRQMNSYYSNRIEGQATLPADIDRALRSQFSSDSRVAKLQRLALAHIRAESELEGVETETALSFDFLRTAHAGLYRQLDESDWISPDQGTVRPGEYRTIRVTVGRHTPPEPESISAFAARSDQVFTKQRSLDELLLVVACAHHRISWVHPFEDGNGRAVRLQTTAALFPITGGLWSVTRAMARDSTKYYQHLDEADSPRSGDYDGRGALSERALGNWCDWFIDKCADQLDFVGSLLRLDGVGDRMSALIRSRAATNAKYRVETIAPLLHLFATGPTERGTFLAMTGLGERTARSALSHLLEVGLVTSPTHRSRVRIAFPLDSLSILFPDLYPEAASLNQ